MLFKKEVCRFKSSDTVFRLHLAETLDEMGYKPSYTDPDVLIRKSVKPNVFEYYEYIL